MNGKIRLSNRFRFAFRTLELIYFYHFDFFGGHKILREIMIHFMWKGWAYDEKWRIPNYLNSIVDMAYQMY